MDVVGEDVVVGQQHRRAVLDALDRQPGLGVDAGRAQDRQRDAVAPRPVAQPVLGRDAAARARRLRAPRPPLVDARAGAVAVDAGGRNVDEALWYASRPRQRGDELAACADRRGRRRAAARSAGPRTAPRAAGRASTAGRDRRRSARCRARAAWGRRRGGASGRRGAPAGAAGRRCAARRHRSQSARPGSRRLPLRARRCRPAAPRVSNRVRTLDTLDHAAPDYHKAQRPLVHLRRRRHRAEGRDGRRPDDPVRLPQRRLRHLQGQDPRRRRSTTARTRRPRSPTRKRRKGLALFCVAKPQTDLVIEVREVRRAGDIQVRACPAASSRSRSAAPDVAIVKLKLPANERLQYLAGQYVDLLLKDGRRRSFSLATPPHDDALLELHVRHVPGGFFTDAALQRVQGPRDPALRRAAGVVLPARGLRQADRSSSPAAPASRRSRRSSSTRCITGSTAADGAVLGRAREARSLPARAARASGSSEPQLHASFRCSPSRRRTTTGRAGRARPPGGARRFRRSRPATRSTPAARRR